MPTKLFIRKALTLKNRLVKEIKDTQERIRQYNVFRGDIQVPYKVEDLIKTLNETTLKLIELKAAIQSSNVAIYPYLCEMEELKSMVAFRRTIPIDPRTQVLEQQGYNKDPLVIAIHCVIKTVENDEAIAVAEKKIGELQEAVDHHNATAQVEVSFSN